MRHRILHLMCLLTCVVVLTTAAYGRVAQVICPPGYQTVTPASFLIACIGRGT
jgi:hypothetical protein